MGQIDLKKAINVRDNINRLREASDLTEVGLADGADISLSTIQRISKLKTNISSINETKINTFFGLENGEIYQSTPIELPINNPELPFIKFKEDNSKTIKYFISLSEEYNIAKFVRKSILKSSYFKEGRRKKEILEKLKTFSAYNPEFSEDAIYKEVERMHKEDNTLKVEKLHTNDSVFLYSINDKIEWLSLCRNFDRGLV